MPVLGVGPRVTEMETDPIAKRREALDTSVPIEDDLAVDLPVDRRHELHVCDAGHRKEEGAVTSVAGSQVMRACAF